MHESAIVGNTGIGTVRKVVLRLERLVLRYMFSIVYQPGTGSWAKLWHGQFSTGRMDNHTTMGNVTTHFTQYYIIGSMIQDWFWNADGQSWLWRRNLEKVEKGRIGKIIIIYFYIYIFASLVWMF